MTKRDEVERRYRWYINDSIRALAHRDALLNACLTHWLHNEALPFRWVAETYIPKAWEACEEALKRCAPDYIETWQALFPRLTRDTSPSAIDTGDHERSLIERAAHVKNEVLRSFRSWLELQPPPPIIITREQYERLRGPIPEPTE